MMMGVLVIGERADEPPAHEAQHADDPELDAAINGQAQSEVVQHDGDDEGDEYSDDEPHRVYSLFAYLRLGSGFRLCRTSHISIPRDACLKSGDGTAIEEVRRFELVRARDISDCFMH
jgi:hypothetical protein